ncbi:hypothetical protein Tco_0125440, partial [Tanacetum coccineum]
PRKDSESIDQEKDDNVNNTNNVNVASTNEGNAVGGKTSIELRDEPNMPALENIVYSDDDEDVGAKADMKNLDAFMHLLLKDEDGEEVDVHLYRSMIGSLMYLTSSRPDIMYLKGQPKLGLWYPKDSPFDLVAYTDSDYAGASLDRKSTDKCKIHISVYT